MARRWVETPDFVAAASRFIRRTGERVAQEDPTSMRLLVMLEDELARAREVAVNGLRDAGFADREIGEALGVTQQAVQQRFPRAA